MGRYGGNGADTGKRYGRQRQGGYTGARDTATARAMGTAGYVRTARETARLGVYGDGNSGTARRRIGARQPDTGGNGQGRWHMSGGHTSATFHGGRHIERARRPLPSFGGYTSARITGLPTPRSHADTQARHFRTDGDTRRKKSNNTPLTRLLIFDTIHNVGTIRPASTTQQHIKRRGTLWQARQGTRSSAGRRGRLTARHTAFIGGGSL